MADSGLLARIWSALGFGGGSVPLEMTTDFAGKWTSFKCSGPPVVGEILSEGAVLDIELAQPYRIKLEFNVGEAVDIPWALVDPSPAKLAGEFTFGADNSEPQRFYYEISACTPYGDISRKPRRIYGLMARIVKSERFGEELEDPGAWEAEEEEGPNPDH